MTVRVRVRDRVRVSSRALKIGSLPTTAAGVGTSAAGAAEGAMVGAPRGAAVGAAVGAGGAGASHECSWHQMP